MLRIEFLSTSCEIVNIGLGNGFVPSGNKSLSEPVFIQNPVTMYHHKVTMC